MSEQKSQALDKTLDKEWLRSTASKRLTAATCLSSSFLLLPCSWTLLFYLTQ